ncbi:MAG: amidohydrolase family protein [Thermoprotei archaeon]
MHTVGHKLYRISWWTTTSNRVIDCHVHVIPLEMMKPDVRQVFTASKTYDPHVYTQIMSPKGLVQVLDRDGVEWANIISYPAPEVMGFGHTLVEFVGNYCKEYQDRLRPVVSVDPIRDDNPVSLLEEYRSRFGSNWVKLHPVHQLFKPNAYIEDGPLYKKLAGVYEYAEANRITLTFHTGTSIFPHARIKYGDPLLLDDVAVDYPKLKIVMAHGGRPFWTQQAYFLLRRHSNVYLDISGIPQAKLLEYFPRLLEVWEKAIFGSDWPTMGVKSIADCVRQLSALGLPRQVLDGILYENIRKLV